MNPTIPTMFSLKNIYLAFTILVISSFSINILQAQDSEEYFRYFELKMKSSVDIEDASLSEKTADYSFSIHSTCSTKHSIIIAVPASYPKRIDAIKDELAQRFKKEISKSQEDKIQVIKVSDLQSFCQ
ncbi:MAG: hypothetical protein AAGC47_00605 [Bacteroidota bacterium]